MWAHLVTRWAANTPELTESRRLTDPADIQAAEAARPSTLPSAAGPDDWIGDLEQSPTMLDEPNMLNNLAALRKAAQDAYSTLTNTQTDIDDYNAISAIGIR